MKRSLAFLLLAPFCLASSQTPGEYFHLRHAYGIKAPAPQPVLDDLIGSKVCEIDGIVKGTFKIGYGSFMAQLERPSGDTVVVEADALPDWLSEGDVKVRMIVRATRDQATSPLRMALLAVTTERTVVEYEALSKQRVKPAAKPPREASQSSRGVVHRDFRLPENQLTPYYSNFIRHQNPKLSAGEADRIATGILGFSERYGINDPRLIVAIIMEESGFDPNSVSRTGAVGLGQLMPGTAKWMGVDSHDDLANIEGCVKLVATHLGQYYRETGDWTKSFYLMLAAYNAGEGAVKRHGGIPPYRETIAYIRHVITNYRQLCGY